MMCRFYYKAESKCPFCYNFIAISIKFRIAIAIYNYNN